MIKHKLWKLQQTDKLSPPMPNSSGPTTPSDVYNSFVLTDKDKEELEGFSIPPAMSFPSKSGESKLEKEKDRSMFSKSLRLQEMQRRVKERDELRLSTEVAPQTMLRMQEELKLAEKQLQEKELELMSVNSQLTLTEESAKLRKRHNEDIANNENMLRFKDNQLTNLKAIHAEIVESARKEIVREKLLRQQNQQKLATRMKTLEDLRTKLGQKENLIRYIEDLSKEKIKLDKSLEILREEEATKMTMRSGAIRTVVESIVHNYKGKVEAECEEKIKIVRDSSMVAKSSKELKKMLDNKGIPERSYYTFSQLKYVLEFNHKTNKTGEKILDIFEREIKPKLMEVVEDIEEPQELTDLRSEIIRLEDFKGQDEAELKQQQFAIQQLELQKKQLQNGLAQIKKKSQIK